MNTFARINLLDRFPALVAVDLEVCPQTSRIRAIGAVRTGKDPPLSWKGDNPRLGVERLAHYLDGAALVVGHNLGRFDLAHLAAEAPGSWPERLSYIDSLWLSALAWPEPRTLRLKKISREGLFGRGSSQRSRRRCAGRHGADGRGALDAHRDLGSGRRPCRCAPWARARSRGVVKWCGLLPSARSPRTRPWRARCRHRAARARQDLHGPHRPNPATGPRRRRIAAVPADTDRLGPAGRGALALGAAQVSDGAGRARGGARPDVPRSGLRLVPPPRRQPGGAQALVRS